MENALLVGLSLHARGAALLHDSDLAGRLPLADELIEIGRRRGLAVFALIGHEYVVQWAATHGDVGVLTEHADRIEALVRTYRWQQSTGMLAMHRGLLAHLGDDLDAAEEHYRSAATVLRRNGGLDVDRIAGVAAFSVASTRGRLATLEPLLHSFQPVPPQALDMFAVVLAAAGHADRAHVARAAAPPIRHDFFRSLFLTVRALAVLGLAEVPAAAPLYAELSDFSGQLGGAVTGAFALGPVDTLLGDLAALLDQPERAAAHYRSAAALARRCGSASWAAAAEQRLSRL